MDSALNPREIQQRIRSGESLAQVAEAAGVPENQVAPFAAPVLAEREHIAGLARGSMLRQRGDGQTTRSLHQVVTQRMQTRRLDVEDLDWDAYRLPDRTWRITARLTQGDLVREAWFVYDPRARFSVTDNADARWLVRDESFGAQGDEEATVDLDDELALVRATSEDEEPAATVRVKGLAVDEEDVEGYISPEFAEVDGLYDIVGPDHAAADELYEMLAGISEDSVRIYEGLGEVVVEEATSDPDQDEDLELADGEAAAPEVAATEPTTEPTEELPTAEQEALIDAPAAAKRRPAKRRGRASVPAWDDILFGGPKK